MYVPSTCGPAVESWITDGLLFQCCTALGCGVMQRIASKAAVYSIRW